MFFQSKDFTYKYVPILSISPSEMSALEELPSKDKDCILPVFSLKGWVGSNKLESSLKRIAKAIDSRYWIADIDDKFLADKRNEVYEYPREVFYEVEELLKSDNGYSKWCEFVTLNQNIIPVLQLHDFTQFESQLVTLSNLERGVVLRFNFHNIESGKFAEYLNVVKEKRINDILIIFDFEQLTSSAITDDKIKTIVDILHGVHENIPGSLVSLSGSSFPDSFSPFENGENPIIERLLYNKVKAKLDYADLIYSDRGSARIEKSGGGGGIPTPRIDYPLFNDWRFVRKEFEGKDDPTKDEKSALYTLAAKQVMASNYWDSKLDLWGVQLIELTAKGDSYGINNPQKCTAARINIHLYLQLHYDLQGQDDLYDTDEDWED